MPKKKTPAYEQYAKDVLDGKVTACKYVKLACQRYFNDLKRKDIYLDRKEADRVIKFISNLKLHKGEKAGQKIPLQPHQKFILANQFGWKRKDGYRRFRVSYEEVARKNAKTTMEAAKQLYHLVGDKEKGPNIYATATKEDQAKIVVNDAAGIVENTPALKDKLQIYKAYGQARRIVYQNKAGFISALGSDSKRQDGLDPSWASVDEYHAFPDDELKQVIQTAFGSRKEPFLDIITTAGKSRHSACYNFRDVVIKVLEGVIEDDELFGIIFTLDEGDSYKDESVWGKANPNLDVAISKDYIRQQVKNAKNEGADTEVAVLTKNFNVWTDSASTWIQHDLWQSLEWNHEESELIEAPCYGGLDLSMNTDLSAFVLAFDLGDHIHFKYWFFTPEERKHARDQDRGTPFSKWVREGYLIQNEGDVIEYSVIEDVIRECAEKYNLISVGYDHYNAHQLAIKLNDEGIEMEPFSQGIMTMSYPTKELERRVRRKAITHETNPCMDWQLSNVEIKQDTNENIKIHKSSAKAKVDGAVASVMALGMAIENENKQESSFEAIIF